MSLCWRIFYSVEHQIKDVKITTYRVCKDQLKATRPAKFVHLSQADELYVIQSNEDDNTTSLKKLTKLRATCSRSLACHRMVASLYTQVSGICGSL